MKFLHRPVHSFEDTARNFEQLEGKNILDVTSTVGGALAGTLPNPSLVRPTWTALPYNATNWTNVGAGYQVGQYSLDGLGFVRVRGQAKSVAGYAFGAGSATIATLPAGFRPAAGEDFLVYQGDSGGNRIVIRLEVSTAGVISLADNTTAGAVNTGTASYLTLSGIMFQQGN